MSDAEVRRRLLRLAHEALEARVRGDRLPHPPADLALPMCGLFVTIHCRGDLRGCLGTLEGDETLGHGLVRLAADVSCQDPRFRPVSVDELEHVTIDLSLLTPPEVVSDPQTIVVGRDGLIVEHGRRRGLLLPQVAIEHRWDAETFLAHTCLKANLPPDAWRTGARVLRFEAEVFGDRARSLESESNWPSRAEPRERVE
jgi:AmmeMemoRadiSam system protein A